MTKENRKRVVLEPDLEVMAGHLCPAERRKLAASFRLKAAQFSRWARELQVSAGALEPQPAPRFRPGYLPASGQRLN